MKRRLLEKLLLSVLVVVSAAGLSLVQAHAEWKLDSNGWWYSKGSSWSVGWDNINGQWYYFDSNGYMKTGWQQINGKWYHFNSDGYMETGWINDGGKKYLLDSDGAMVTGNFIYKFDSLGELISAEPYIDDAKKQEQAEIKLHGNPTTGYNWEYNIDDNSIVKLDSTYDILDTTDPEICGAGGTFIWKFSGIKMGTTKITFKYLRPWDESSLYETKVYNCTVDKDKNILLEEVKY